MRNKELLKRILATGCVAAMGLSTCAYPVKAQTNEEKDYILGRPLTEKEVQEMKKYEPKTETVFAPDDIVVPQVHKKLRTRSLVARDNNLDSRFSLVDENKVTSVKNQNLWGTGWGQNGYFWLSYEDGTTNAYSDNSVHFYQAQPGNNYDHNYQYDGSLFNSTINLASGGSAANRFQVPYNSNGEKLKAVSFAVNETNVNYDIRIFKNCNDTDPTRGEEIYASQKSGQLDYAGYYTIPLDNEVDLNTGDTFSVVVKFTSGRNQRRVKVFVDWTYSTESNDRQYKYTNATKPGESFTRSADYYSWSDYGVSNGVTPRIKAFTVNR